MAATVVGRTNPQLEAEIRDFENWLASEKLSTIAKAYFSGLWRKHVVDDYPAAYPPEMF